MGEVIAACGTPLKRLQLTVASGAVLPVFLAQYDASRFTSDLFGRAAIEFPADVSRSVRKRQAEYFHGRLCAKAALSPFLLANNPVRTGSFREPIWPAGIIGSISHSQKVAVAIALRSGKYAGVGIDVEHVIGEQSKAALIATVVSPAELAYLGRVAGPLSLNQLLTIVFSAKESFFKATFPLVGNYFDFSAIAVTRINIQTMTICFVANDTLCVDIVKGSLYDATYHFLDDQTVLTALLR